MAKSSADIMLAFVEAIEALGGIVEPRLIHDQPLSVLVPERHQARAQELIDKLADDLRKLDPS